MSKESRHHHYLPQFYLKGFTRSGSKNSKLTVIDFKEKKYFETITRNVGGIRDFNIIHIEGEEPDAIEKELSSFEGKTAKALREIEDTLSFNRENKDLILTLIALLSIRTPVMRENWRKTEAQIADIMIDQTLATKERWESKIERMKRDGIDVNYDIKYEEIKEFFDSKKYTIKVAREHHIAMEFAGIEAILPLLYARKWLLIKSKNETGPFITNDNPVVLTWLEPDKIPPLYRNSPGHALRGTKVYFPLSRNLSLLGIFDGREGLLEGNRQLVATLNCLMMNFTYKQIYSPKIGFYFLGVENQIINGNIILKQFNA